MRLGLNLVLWMKMLMKGEGTHVIRNRQLLMKEAFVGARFRFSTQYAWYTPIVYLNKTHKRSF